MPTDEIVTPLIVERAKLDRAIEALQGPVKRRGRPPKSDNKPHWVQHNGARALEPEPATEAAKTRKKRTPAQRKKQALKMKLYWKKKKAAATT